MWLPLYGLPYRPWMRTATYCLFIAVSILSMALGFYDLIKHFPLLHRVGAPSTVHIPFCSIVLLYACGHSFW